MASVTVPTSETCSVTFWMKNLVFRRRPVMLAGPSGTGKTQIVNGMLAEFDPQEMLHTTINFNFYTTSSVLMTTMVSNKIAPFLVNNYNIDLKNHRHILYLGYSVDEENWN
jgi:uridine kinase